MVTGNPVDRGYETMRFDSSLATKIKNMKEKGLPKWFRGEEYTEGGTVQNRFTGEEAELSAKELSMYDFIMGSEAMIEMMGGFMDPNTARFQNDMSKGISWFRQSNPSAYMTILD